MWENPWIETYSGHVFHLNRPVPHEVFIEDIAHALAAIPRFTGHCHRTYSVAEHSYNVMRVLKANGRPDLALWGLLHDAHEAYYGDMSTPLKSLLPQYTVLTSWADQAIFRRFGLGETVPQAVKYADAAMLMYEKSEVMGELPWDYAPETGGMAIDPDVIKIIGYDAPLAEGLFLSSFHLEHVRWTTRLEENIASAIVTDPVE